MARPALLWLGVLAWMAAALPAWAEGPKAPHCSDRPVPGNGRVVTGTVESFGRLPSRQTAYWFAAGSLGALVAHQFDESTSRRLSGSQRADQWLSPGAVIGGAAVQIGAGVGTYAIGRLSGHACAGAVGADLIRAHLVAEALTLAFKATVRRTRPDGGEYSFPSGHASVSFATATVLHQQFGWKAGVPAYAMASYVALSRVQARRHYLSDVVFGAAVGIISGHVAVPRVTPAAVTVVPTVTFKRAAITVVWTP